MLKLSKQDLLLHSVIILAMVLSAFYLRYPQLGASSLWLDDAWVAVAIRLNFFDVLQTSQTAPGFSWLLVFWSFLFGDSVLSLQSPAFIFGILGPIAIYLFALKVGIKTPLALLAATFLITSPNHISMSGSVKQYSLEAFFTVILFWLSYSIIKETNKSKWILLFVFSLLATITSSVLALVVAAAYLAAGIALLKDLYSKYPNLNTKLIVMPAISTIGFASFALFWWLSFVQGAANETLRNMWRDGYINTGDGIVNFFVSLFKHFLFLLHNFSPIKNDYVAIILCISLLLVMLRRFNLGVLLVGPIIFAFIASSLHMLPIGDKGGRTDIFMYSSVALLISAGLNELWKLKQYLSIPARFLTLALIMGNYALADRSDAYYPQDIRPLVQILEEKRQDKDGIIVWNHSNWAFGLYTTLPISIKPTKQYATGFQVEILDPNVIVLDDYWLTPTKYEPSIEAACKRFDRIWFIASHYPQNAVDEIEKMFLNRSFKKLETFYKRGAFLALWSK